MESGQTDERGLSASMNATNRVRSDLQARMSTATPPAKIMGLVFSSILMAGLLELDENAVL